MGSSAFKRHLIHKAVFLSGSASRTSSGQVTHTWSVAGTVVGRFVQRRHALADPSQGLMMAHEHLWLCDSAAQGTIAEEYRVRKIVDSSGAAIAEAAGTWRVEALIPLRTDKLHHYELTLEKVE